MNFLLAPALRGAASRRTRGQGLTEYIVITFLVAVGTIGVVGLFGDNLRQLFGGSAESLAGATSTENGGSAPGANVLQWSMKGAQGVKRPGGGTGGTENNPGNPGGTTNRPGGPGGGNPGGTTNSERD